MHRFYLSPEQCASGNFTLTGSEAHHAVRVLRVQRGEQAVVLDGVGGELRCEIRSAGRGAVELAVLERKSIPPVPCRITLLQAIPKGKIIESIIQKATELGAARIVPLLTERVVARLDTRERADKAGKWQQVAIEAIKQSGAAWLPRVESPPTLDEFLARNERTELALVASLQPNAQHPRRYFTEFQSKQGRPPTSACIWIGPEGDFTPAEVQQIEASGARPITLGRLVLRVETAAIYCLSILNCELNVAANTVSPTGKPT
jgi:16S rRNA (uracil1498-N3)-methyltransferase